jgi:hypothetical protein
MSARPDLFPIYRESWQIIDSSVWIEYFKNRKFKLGDIIDSLIQEDKVYTNGIVISELLLGTKDNKESKKLKEAFLGLHYIELDSERFLKVGYNGYLLKKKGIRVPLTDLIIATTCIEKILF